MFVLGKDIVDALTFFIFVFVSDSSAKSNMSQWE
jgi:hypothetical protein